MQGCDLRKEANYTTCSLALAMAPDEYQQLSIGPNVYKQTKGIDNLGVDNGIPRGFSYV